MKLGHLEHDSLNWNLSQSFQYCYFHYLAQKEHLGQHYLLKYQILSTLDLIRAHIFSFQGFKAVNQLMMKMIQVFMQLFLV